MFGTTRRIAALAMLVGTLVGLAPVAHAQPVEPPPTCPVDEALVKVRDGVDPAPVVARHGGVILSTLAGVNIQVVGVMAGTLETALPTSRPTPTWSSPKRTVARPSLSSRSRVPTRTACSAQRCPGHSRQPTVSLAPRRGPASHPTRPACRRALRDYRQAPRGCRRVPGVAGRAARDYHQALRECAGRPRHPRPLSSDGRHRRYAGTA